MKTPEYEASIEILIGQDQANSVPAGNLVGDVQGLSQLTQTMAEGVKRRPLAEAVIERNSLQVSPADFENRLTVRQIADTSIIWVSYRDLDPDRAQQVASTIGEVFSEQVSEVSPSNYNITATTWEPAERPVSPASPNLVLNMSLALLIGSILGVCLALWLEYWEGSWRSSRAGMSKGETLEK